MIIAIWVIAWKIHITISIYIIKPIVQRYFFTWIIDKAIMLPI